MILKSAVHTITALSLVTALFSGTSVSAQSQTHSSAVSRQSLLSSCSVDALSSLVGAGVTISSAQPVQAVAGLCRVQGVVVTSGDGAPDGEARFELNLPTNWNHRFLFLGGGGFDGNIPQAPLAQLSAGYVTLATDSGHVEGPGYSGGLDASWVLTASGKPDEAKIADYAYRSRSQVNEKVRPLVVRFYGGAIEHAYFMGCSGGGREALVEAQRNFQSYDGFVAGNPLVSAGTALLSARNYRVLMNAPIPYAKFAAIDKAVIEQCDRADGVADGLVQNPARCNFDPQTLVSSGVLTQAEAHALKVMMSAPIDTEGRRIGFGNSPTGLGDLSLNLPGMTGGLAGLSVYLADGLKAGTTEPWGPLPSGTTQWMLANGAVTSIGLNRPNLSVLDPSISTPDGQVYAEVARIVETTWSRGVVNPEALAPFFASGRKLIMYHGFNDTILDPYAAVAGYAAISQAGGGLEKSHDSARLFMAPGMGHCFGGSGPNAFDALGAMEAWVEKGAAPDQILAIHLKDNIPGNPIDRSMPLCAFPVMARYDGKGDVNQASSWACEPADRRMLESGPNGDAAGITPILRSF